ncbi:MAG: hypothetical protein H6711_13940 [Myxococcales bacterium]|nr:hypothetical protein [Myxococcales bacterium]
MTRATFGLGRRPDLLLATLTVALAACNGDDAATASESATGGLTSGVSATTSASTSAGTMSASDSSSGGSGGESMTSGSGGSSGSSGGSSSTSAGETSTSGTSAATITDGTTTDDPGPVCGNGIVEDGEACDDGDNIDNNACSNACTKVPCDQQEGGNLEDVLSYIWISNSSQATVSKINTKTAIEEGRYRVQGGSPSRTSVNLQGDVAVSSRDPGAVTKIAAKVENCVDKNNDGVITTSTGPNDIKNLGEDECVLWTKTIPSAGYNYGPRATAWDSGQQDPDTCEFPPPRLWIGWMEGQTGHFERLDGATGETLDQLTYPWPSSHSPYGGAVDAAGNFYATGLNQSPAIKIDAQSLQITDLGIPNGCKYGMTLDGNGDIWAGACFGEGVYHWNHLDNTWTTLPNSGGTRVNGIMADAAGNVWGAGSSSCRLVHIDVETKSYVNTNIPLPGCSNPWGVSIDFEGYVWVVDMSASVAFKVDPETYQVVATVSGLVGPYTYSDMTGVALKQQVIPQ